MKVYILLVVGSLLGLTACAIEKSLDITNIIIKSKEIADKNFEEDAMGNKYSRSKPWHIYKRTIKNTTFKLMVGSNFNTLSTKPSHNLKFKNKSTQKISLVNEKRLLADDLNFLVEMQSPFFNSKTGTYATVLWIRDKSWSSGFCVLVEFRIIKDICKVIKATSLTPSDIQELH